jgi:hypothetical protein
MLAGCIQPVSNTDLTRTAIAPFITPTQPVEITPTQPVVDIPTQPVVSPPTATPSSPAPTGPVSTQPNPTPPPLQADALPLIERFVRDRGDTPTNLRVWANQPQGPDRLLGYSYETPGGAPCAGFLLMSLVNDVWQPSNGAKTCAQPPLAGALAAATFFSTSDGNLYTIVFGRVDNTAVAAVAVMFDDGSTQNATPLGGFLLVKPGVAGAQVITAIDALGNTVIANIPQTPVQ